MRHDQEIKLALRQRDDAEQALSQVYYVIFGRPADWSKINSEEATEEITDAVNVLKMALQAAEADAKRLDFVSRGYGVSYYGSLGWTFRGTGKDFKGKTPREAIDAAMKEAR